MNRFVALTAVGLALAASAAPARAAIIVGGIPFADNAFADQLVSSGGGVAPVNAATLELAAVGSDLNGFVDNLNSNADFIQLRFTDNLVVNGTGDDLALFDLQSATDSFFVSLTLNGPQITVTTASTGLFNGNGDQINVGYLDLTAFGLAPGAVIDTIFVRGNFAEFAAVGALNSVGVVGPAVPEPATMTVFGVMAAGAFGVRRRKAKAA